MMVCIFFNIFNSACDYLSVTDVDVNEKTKCLKFIKLIIKTDIKKIIN